MILDDKKSSVNKTLGREISFAVLLIVIVLIGSIISTSASIALRSEDNSSSDTSSVDEMQDDSEQTDKYSVIEELDEDDVKSKDLIVTEEIEDIDELFLDNHALNARDNMTEKGQKVFDAMYKAALSRQNFVYKENGMADKEHSGEMSEAFVTVLSYVRRDHPELFWISGGIETLTESDSSETVYTVEFKYNCDVDDISGIKKDIDSKINQVLASVSGSSDYEKALYIHDWIVDNTVYDKEFDSFAENEKDLGRTIYGMLIKGRTLCDGYSKTFQYFMNKLGIPCTQATGPCNDGELHAWNIIVLDGEYYQVDPTWDDPSGDNQKLHHNYFCITDQEMYRSRTLNESYMSVPVCTATKYNYHIYNGLYCENYDETVMSNAVRFYVENDCDQIEIKFPTSEEAKNAINEFKNSDAVKTALNDNGYSFGGSYIVYDDLYTFEYYL